MKQIKQDGDLNVMLQDLRSNIPKIIEQAKKVGLKLNTEIWPTEDEILEVVSNPRHRLFEKYYGTSDYVKVYNVVEGVVDDPSITEKGATYLRNWKGARGRQQSANPLQEVIGWGTNYDPVSKLIIAAMIAVKADNASFNFRNEDRNWLEHNLGYYKKIGFTSQYFPDVLRKAERDYGRTEQITLSDTDVEYLVNVALVIQRSLEGLSCKPYEIEDVMDRALDRNNKSAESAPGFRNMKHDDVKEDVLADAKFIRDNCDYHDLQLVNEQKRIQSGGNILFDKYYPLSLDNEGHIVFNYNEVIEAVRKIASERGYMICYYEDIPEVLPELSTIIQVDELPLSMSERDRLIESGAPEFLRIKDKISGEWRYKYKISLPQVFTIISDKYPDLTDIGHEVFTKHRSIKAAMGAHNKVGQSYLYSFLDAYKDKNMKFDNPYYSLVAQWSHPDDLKAMVSASAYAAFPEIYEGVGISVPYADSDLKKFEDYKIRNNYAPRMMSDDKTGFDMVQKAFITFLFYTSYFSIPFEMNEQNVRLFKMFIMNELINVVSCIDDLVMYFEIIGSGSFTTSLRGTYDSNTATGVMRQKFADDAPCCLVSESDESDQLVKPEDGGDLNEFE